MFEKPIAEGAQCYRHAVSQVLEGPLSSLVGLSTPAFEDAIRGLAGDIHREHIRLGRSLLFDLTPLGPVGEAEPAEDPKYSQ